MKEFTFGVFCYNQERYIIEHLESIKYQILNYGNDMDFYLVIGDDASSDHTMEYILYWIQENKNIFKDIKINDYTTNKGIVGNYISLLKAIHTDNYKILAGDDLYYKNNIFLTDDFQGVLLSPTIEFCNDAIRHTDHNDLKLIMIAKNKKKEICKKMKYETFIEAPGVFMKKSLIGNDLYFELEKYKWIEDVPLWNYLFNKKDTKVAVYNKPLIMYRINAGISHNTEHIRKSEFELEEEKIMKEFCIYKHNKINNRLYKFKNSILKRAYKYYYKNQIMEFNDNVVQAEHEAGEYLLLIKERVENFKQNMK